MALKLVSTGTIVKMYLQENEKSALELAKASDVSLRTIMRILNDETKLSYDVALGMNKLLPEISADFLISYDLKYQVQKRTIEKENENINISKVNSRYQMKKLYKDLATDEIAMFEKAKQIFGLNNIVNECYVDVNDLSYCFSLANGEKENHLIWLKATYEDCRARDDFANLSFNKDLFNRSFVELKKRTFTNDIRTTIYNMEHFCKKCGINFYYRQSIPGARIKAVALRDKKGLIYIFVSDLFKCVENLWLAFIHECMHIYNDDFDKVDNIKRNIIDSSIDENYIEEEAISYFIGNDYLESDFESIKNITMLANKNMSPISIVVEIARFKTSKYSDYELNKYIHYYKTSQINFN